MAVTQVALISVCDRSYSVMLSSRASERLKSSREEKKAKKEKTAERLKRFNHIESKTIQLF